MTISLKELAKLIKICKNDGVSHLKYGDIELSMIEPEKPFMTPAPQVRGSAKKAKEIEEKGKLQEGFNLSQDVYETLHIENPALAEEMLIRGELESKDH